MADHMLSREHFEDQVLRNYFSTSFLEPNNKEFTTLKGYPDLFKLQPDGQYIRDEIQAMWHGYRIAMKRINES